MRICIAYAFIMHTGNFFLNLQIRAYVVDLRTLTHLLITEEEFNHVTSLAEFLYAKTYANLDRRAKRNIRRTQEHQ